MQPEPTHYGFADESHWNTGRYRTIGLVTMPAARVGEIDDAVQAITRDAHIRELKWKSVSSDRHRQAAESLLDLVAAPDNRHDIRIDVVIWDTKDSRHAIPGRDDIANLGRMYYRLMINVIELRWPEVRSWSMSVDERNDTNWETLADCLAGRSRKAKTAHEPLLVSSSSAGPPRRVWLAEVSSTECALVQIADLFAGLAAFSWNHSVEHQTWEKVEVEQAAGQQSMFPALDTSRVSNASRFKHQALAHFMAGSPSEIVLGRNHGLKTYRPRHPINFWLYEPHRASDKAPRRRIA